MGAPVLSIFAQLASPLATVAGGVGQLQVLRPVGPAARSCADMVEGRALVFPKGRVGDLEPVSRHRPAAEGTETGLLLPERAEERRVRRRGGLAHRPAGTGQPRRAQAARTVLRRRQAIVIGPTPPGTGVIQPATSAQLS